MIISLRTLFPGYLVFFGHFTGITSLYLRKKKAKKNIWAALFKTYVSYGFTGLILNNILSVLWVSVLHISKMLAPIINLVISIPINFFMNKLLGIWQKK